MSVPEKRVLRSHGHTSSDQTPESGDTSSAPTHTWDSNGTSQSNNASSNLGANLQTPASVFSAVAPPNRENAAPPNPACTAPPDPRSESVPPGSHLAPATAPGRESAGRSGERQSVNTIINANRENESQLSVLMAELQVRKAELELAQKAAAEANSRLQIARIEVAHSASASVAPADERVVGWVASHYENRPAVKENTELNPGFSSAYRDTRADLGQTRKVDTQVGNRAPYGQMVHKIPQLPHFDGNISEWIAFRAEFEDSAPNFSSINNVGRIRRALRGEARLAVKSIMYTVSDPYEIMEALERHFGDPEEIVLTEIHNVKRMPRLAEDSSNIVTFASHVANTVATIKALRQDHYLHAPELVSKIVDKLNLIVRYEWAKFRQANLGTPELVAMANFLNDISQAARRTHHRYSKLRAHVHTVNYENADDQRHRDGRERERAPSRPSHSYRQRDYSSGSDSSVDSRYSATVAAVNSQPRNNKKPAQSRPPYQPRSPAQPRTPAQPNCAVCSGDHKVANCADFLKKSVTDRWEIARNSKLCYKCLDRSHRLPYKCKYVPCGMHQCEAGHHKLLHGLNSITQPIRANVSNVNHAYRSNTYLKVVPVEISGPLGTTVAYALLDGGSTMSLIERETADLVAPREKSHSLALEGIGGLVMDHESCRVDLAIRGQCSRSLEKISAYTIEKLNLSSQEVSRDLIEQCEHLSDIVDQLCYERATPTILIGQDNWGLIVSRQLRMGEPSLPIASLTSLGWVLHGQHDKPRDKVGRINHLRPATTEDEILNCMKEHFSIESLGVEKKLPRTDPDKRAIDILDATCRKLPGENRYEAGLLWRSDNESLPDNKAHALRRLYSLERKLDGDASFKTEYTAQIDNLISKGYAEIINSQPPQEAPRTWYLPHFATRHAQKLKLRLVFDAKATAYGTSLNQSLLTGPDLLKSLFGVLLRFREGKTAVIADVKEMFLQVGVLEQDRDSLRFLWRGEDRSRPPQEYRMRRLIFGSASSPTTALYVKNKNALENKNVYPIAADITVRNTYMDDMLVALDQDEIEVKQIVNDLYKLNMQASFELRGFASNNPNVISDVQPKSTDVTVIGKSDTERTLGLIWNHKQDTLGFNVNLRNTPVEVLNGSKLPTKRQVTSSAMSVYDPMGYASPISVLGKTVMQEIWRTGIGWDDQITESCRAPWMSFVDSLQNLRNLAIPRHVPAMDRKGDIHTFCDASEKVYAAAVYFVGRDETGCLRSSLIASKARAAPLKVVSIPRLELQSCVLGTRLAESVVAESDYVIEKRYYWSDSRTVLAWIKADPRTFKSFVAHRLAEIESSTTPADWYWVPSAQNVADDATKGAPANFDSNHRWFFGPEFIIRDKSEWPQEKSPPSPPPATGEERVTATAMSITKYDKFDHLPPVERFSRLTRLVRATACVIVSTEVFKTRLLLRNPETDIKNDHVKRAQLLLLERSQYNSFEEEVKLIRSGQPLPKKSPIHRVAVKMNRANVMVLDTRVDRGELELPVLHAKENFTKLLIHHYHEKFNHSNHMTVINEIKQKYYIVGLRSAMRYICNQCQWCRTYKGATLKTPVGDLPAERLLAYQPPFTATAVDLYGPMNITIGRRREKRWGVLFTCLTTRAVHLELAASLSASSTILALRRLIARRGVPTVIYSDNGTNFVGAEREIREAKIALPENLKSHPATRDIVWKKIPPGNPAAGGAWERMVGCVKAALKITLKEKAPHEEVLHTLILEAEHIVNSRPLTPINTDLSQPALTPNHFLLLRSNAMTPWGTFKDDTSLKSWKTAQALADTFWKKWIAEYRPLLCPRSSIYSKSKSPVVGDLVIIADNTMPRGTWPRGVIANTFPGPDGHVRVVDVQTNTGIVRRPTNRLIWICSTHGCADARGGDCRT